MSPIAKGKRQKVKGKRMKSLILFPLYFYLLTTLANVPLLLTIPPAFAQNVNRDVQQAFTLLGQGRVDEAIKAFEAIVRRNPQSLQARLGLAISYRRRGRDVEAWNTYQQVLTQDPNNQLALKAVGLLGTFRPEWQARGIVALTTLLNITPNDIDARAQRALLLGYQGRFGEALADYEIVLRNNPSAEVLIQAAEIYTYAGNTQQALQLFNRYQATGKAITGPPAVAYGRTLRLTGNPNAAVQVLEAQLQRAKTLDSNAVNTRAELALAYTAVGRVNEALAILQPLQGRADAVLPLARSLNEIRLATGNQALVEPVANLYRQGLAATPNPPISLLREAADVFSGLPGGQQTAVQIYRQLVAGAPSDRSLVVQLLALENQLGLISRAELQQRLLSAVQPLPTDRAQLQQLASALLKLDPPDPNLLPVYQTVAQSGVNVPFLNFRIAQMFIQLNNTPEARRALAAYVATPDGSRDLAPQLLAAEIERREGSLDSSAKRYEALITSGLGGNDIINAALRGLAGIRLQQKRPDEALAVYDQLIARTPQDASLQLGRASIAYQAKRLSVAEAEAILNNWLRTQPPGNAPPELFSLVAALPPSPTREPLYTALAQLDPNNTSIQLRLVQVLQERNPAQARAIVRQLISRAPTSLQAFLFQGQLAQQVNDFKTANRVYETILAQDPNNVDALAALGGLKFEERRYGAAQQIYNQVLEFKPQDVDARRALADLAAIDDQPLAALEQLEQLQMQQITSGSPNPQLSERMQQIQEELLRRRGFQPPWEDPVRRGNN
jgi:tetratricopeptide (TPR) repeat protein